MNKLIVLLSLVVSTSSVASTDDAYKTKEDVFSEWLILSTCMDSAKITKEHNRDLDNGQYLLDCVNSAKKRQKAHKI